MCPAVNSAGDTWPLLKGILDSGLNSCGCREGAKTVAGQRSSKVGFPCDAEHRGDQGLSLSAGLELYSEMLSSIPCPHPLGAHSPSSGAPFPNYDNQNTCRHCQMCPEKTKSPLMYREGGQAEKDKSSAFGLHLSCVMPGELRNPWASGSSSLKQKPEKSR